MCQCINNVTIHSYLDILYLKCLALDWDAKAAVDGEDVECVVLGLQPLLAQRAAKHSLVHALTNKYTNDTIIIHT